MAISGIETPRYAHTATLLPNGNVLVAGGFDAGFNILATAEVFDPTSGRFTSTSTMSDARAFHIATLLRNGNVLLTGGIRVALGRKWQQRNCLIHPRPRLRRLVA